MSDYRPNSACLRSSLNAEMVCIICVWWAIRRCSVHRKSIISAFCSPHPSTHTHTCIWIGKLNPSFAAEVRFPLRHRRPAAAWAASREGAPAECRTDGCVTRSSAIAAMSPSLSLRADLTYVPDDVEEISTGRQKQWPARALKRSLG